MDRNPIFPASLFLGGGLNNSLERAATHEMTKHKGLARRLVFYMLKLPMSVRQRQTLEGDYRVALGHERDDAKVKLPAPLVK